MPLNRPSLAQLVERAQTEFDIKLNGVDARLNRSLLDITARMMALVAHGLYGHAEKIIKTKFFVDDADRETLERIGRTFSLPSKKSSAAQGIVTFSGTDTTSIPLGTEVQRADGVKFITDFVTVINGASVDVAVTSINKGASVNTLAGSSLTLVSPIAGINSNLLVDVNGITGGADIETDDAYRSRLKDRMRLAPHGGAPNDYIVWAKQVAGVTRAWCYPLENGDGTVTVRFMMDNSYADGIPQAGDVTAVFNYIDPLKPVGIAAGGFVVVAPTPKVINFTGSIVPNTPEAKAAAEASIRDLFSRKAEPGGVILFTQIGEAISLAEGEIDHDLTSPNTDITTVIGEIAVPGVFTWV